MARLLLTLALFISRATSRHGSRYDYSLVSIDDGVDSRVSIVCKIHGVFVMIAKSHYTGQGCPECGKLQKAKSKIAFAAKKFLSEARSVHGDTYCYDKFKYVRNDIEGVIGCPIHGDFLQTPTLHLSGRGCQKCGRVATARGVSLDMAEVKNRVMPGYVYQDIEKHLAEKSTKIPCVCSRHGATFTSYRAIINGSRPCRKCAFEATADSRRNSFEKVSRVLSYIKGVEFPFLKSEYGNSHSLITGRCTEDRSHPDFRATYLDIAQGKSGCKSCSSKASKEEKRLFEFVKSIFPDAVPNVSIGPMIADIVCESLKIVIEYNGVYWHSTARKTSRMAHRDRRRAMEAAGYRMITIWSDEYKYKKYDIEAYLTSVLRFDGESIAARKCVAKIVDPKTAIRFLAHTHLQGWGVKCRTYIGLYHGDGLVAVAGFRNGFTGSVTELQRVAYRRNTRVLGGLSKLVSNYRKITGDLSPIISYIDRDKFDGKSYYSAGFEKIAESLTMSYVRGDQRVSRHKYKKKNLKDMPGYDPSKREVDICAENGIYAAYNSGVDTVILS